MRLLVCLHACYVASCMLCAAMCSYVALAISHLHCQHKPRPATARRRLTKAESPPPSSIPTAFTLVTALTTAFITVALPTTFTGPLPAPTLAPLPPTPSHQAGHRPRHALPSPPQPPLRHGLILRRSEIAGRTTQSRHCTIGQIMKAGRILPVTSRHVRCLQPYCIAHSGARHFKVSSARHRGRCSQVPYDEDDSEDGRVGGWALISPLLSFSRRSQ